MVVLFQFARYLLGYASRAWPKGSLCDDTQMSGCSFVWSGIVSCMIKPQNHVGLMISAW